MATAFDIPLHSPEFHMVDPYPVFKELRREQPVYWCAGAGYWAITKYDDGLRIHRDPETFCSGQGMTMRGGELEDVRGGETLITLDPPRHTRQRQLVSRAFTPRAVADLEPRIRGIVHELLDAVDPRQTIDFVDALSAPLPIIVIAELLGVPIADRRRFVAWTNASVGRADPEYAQDESLAAAGEMYQYFVDIVEQRRREPEDDLISRLVAVEADADDFTADDLLHLCFLLLAAGNETTRNLISGGLLALIEHPDERDKLRAGDASIAEGVEEMLRWWNPVIHMARTATKDATVRGQQVRAGDQVVMFYGALNRDEEVFGDASDDFRVDRDPNPHVAFGFGQHFCLGANLARLEAGVMFEELLQRFPNPELDGEAQRLRSTMIRGIKHMPVRLGDSTPAYLSHLARTVRPWSSGSRRRGSPS
jgi:cytochrome P450